MSPVFSLVGDVEAVLSLDEFVNVGRNQGSWHNREGRQHIPRSLHHPVGVIFFRNVGVVWTSSLNREDIRLRRDMYISKL